MLEIPCKYILMLVFVAVVCIYFGFVIVAFGVLLGWLGITFVRESREEY